MYRPGTPDTWASPWAMYADLRDHDPVHHVHRPGDGGDGTHARDHWVLSRHADVLAAAVDTATYSSAQGLTVEPDELERLGLTDNRPMVMLDPPEHTAFRRLVARGFTPRQVSTLEPVVRGFVVERVERLRDEGGGDIVEALFKPIGITTGISDVPWHKDCSLGRHSYECCTLTVGVSVTGAGPGSGQLRVVAGSHRARIWPSLLDPADLDLPEVALPTDTGDVTIHLSCTLHMAEPPTERERRVLYTTFRLPALDPQAAAEARHRLLRVARERAPLTVDQPSA